MWGVVLTPPIEPMLAEARPALPPDGMLPGSLHYEQKPDGFRAIVFARADLVRVQSRQVSDLTPVLSQLCSVACRGPCARKCAGSHPCRSDRTHNRAEAFGASCSRTLLARTETLGRGGGPVAPLAWCGPWQNANTVLIRKGDAA